MGPTAPSDGTAAPLTIADIVGGAALPVTVEDLKLHASTKKMLAESNVSIWAMYKIVDQFGWQGLINCLLLKDDSKIKKISEALEKAGLPPLPDDGVRAEARAAKAKRQTFCMTCGKRPKAPGRRKCVWCVLLGQPIEDQIAAAEARLLLVPEADHRPRVPKEEWPEGERWCAGCQSFVPDFYTTGSRCKACASKAAHSTRLKSVYGITRDEYEQLFEFQEGRCYICQRTARSRRLAVDHNHKTGEVRGLLCADHERGCNHAILGNISGIEMARRIVDYLEEPPARRLFGAKVGRVDATGADAVSDGDDIFDPFA